MERLRVRADGKGLEPIPLSDEGSSVPRHEADAEVQRLQAEIKVLQDFACGVSDAIWGRELDWCEPNKGEGLKALLAEVRKVVRERHELKG